MTVSFRIDVETGCLLLGNARLSPLHNRDDAVAQMKDLSLSFPFGNARTAAIDTIVCREPASLILAFKDEQLCDASLSIGTDWVVGDDAQRKVHRVNLLLRLEQGIEIEHGVAMFPWGVVYSLVGRGGSSHFGVKYGPNALSAVVNML